MVGVTLIFVHVLNSSVSSSLIEMLLLRRLSFIGSYAKVERVNYFEMVIFCILNNLRPAETNKQNLTWGLLCLWLFAIQFQKPTKVILSGFVFFFFLRSDLLWNI